MTEATLFQTLGESSLELSPDDLKEFDKVKCHMDASRPMLWSNAEGTLFSVRTGPDYNKNKKKAFSTVELYTCIAADIIQNDQNEKIKHIASIVKLPEQDDSNELEEEVLKACGLPRLFIVNIQVPFKTASLMGGKSHYDDDSGCSIILTFKIKPETVKEALINLSKPDFKPFDSLVEGQIEGNTGAKEKSMKNIKGEKNSVEEKDKPKKSSIKKRLARLSMISSKSAKSNKSKSKKNKKILIPPGEARPALELFKRYNLEASKNPDIRRRFKAILVCDNWDDIDIKGLFALKSYNGKPAILNKLVDLHQAENFVDYLEVDVKIHEAKYASRKGLDMFRGRSNEAFLRVGFTIQGEANDELPEVIIGAANLRNIDLNNVPRVKFD